MLRGLGVELRAVDVPGLEDANDFGTVVLTWEALQYHKANLASQPSKFGRSFRERVLAAQKYSRADYDAAQARRAALREACVRLFRDEVDLLVSPGREAPPPTMAELIGSPLTIRGQAHRLYNLTGQPAVVLPMGFSGDGLPLGLQVAADHWREDLVYQVAAAYEDATPWKTMHPTL